MEFDLSFAFRLAGFGAEGAGVVAALDGFAVAERAQPLRVPGGLVAMEHALAHPGRLERLVLVGDPRQLHAVGRGGIGVLGGEGGVDPVGRRLARAKASR